MKNYSKENYSNYADFEKAMVDECVVSFIPHKANYHDKTVQIVSFTFGDVSFGAGTQRVLKVMVELAPNEISTLVFNLAVNSGTLKLNEEDMLVYEKLNSILNEAKQIREQELIEEAKARDEAIKLARAKREAEKKAAEEVRKAQEAEKKLQLKIQKQLKKLEDLKPEKTLKLFDCPTNYYECLGWMAKHATSIKPSMPDYMEKWFDGKFDATNKNVVDSKKRTVNGHPMQWGLSFRMSFDSEVSGMLEQRATSQNKKVIDSVAFVWDLIENYGFQFTKGAQDIEKIKSEIPNQYISDFEKGLAM